MSAEAPPLALADLLKQYRSEARLSQEELAERARLNVRTVSDIECGVAKAPRAITLSLLAEALALDAGAVARLRAAAGRRGSSVAGVAAAPSVAGGAGERRGLPPAVELIGRAGDIAAACALVRERAARLLTFVGPPGVGKTSLALRVAADLEPAFAGGAVLVELAPLADPALVPTKIAIALGVHGVPGEPLRQTLQRALNERATLLVLDNFEHLLPAAAIVGELLASAPELTIAVTSRTPLRVAGEHEVAVRALAVPEASRTYAPPEVARLPAVGLLVERARATKRDFSLTADNAGAVAELCRALDGIPLAIELVAPRLKFFSPAALAARLARRLPLLEADRADRPARHRTMRAALSWSFELLTASEQAVLRRCSIFRGRFSAEAARAVCIGIEAAPAVLTTLAVLVEHNLLHVHEHDGEPYFELPDLIREFAGEGLDARERDAAYEQLTAHCAIVAPLARLDQTPDDRRPIMDRLERESANFDVLLEWALASGRIELGLQLAYALWTFWYLHGSCAAGLAWCQALLSASERDPGSVPASLLSDAYRELLSLAVTSGDFELADRAATHALALKAQSGDRKGIAYISDVAGVIASQRGDYARAHALIAEGLRLRRELGHPNDIANSLQDLGHSVADSGDTERGRAYLEESLELYDRVAGSLGAGEALQILGVVAARNGDADAAERYSREALAIGERHGHAILIASAQRILARCAGARGDFDDALRLYRDALAAFESASFTEIPDVLDGLAEIAHATGRSRAAARLLGGGAALRTRMQKTIVPADRASYERVVAAVSATLRPHVFDAEWTIGQTLSYAGLRSEAKGLIAGESVPKAPAP
jgi:predicted ATPase/DNA-binding XRE family transcriptional regulator